MPGSIIPGNFYRAEIHNIPSGESYTSYYIYKIPYAQLFFEKSNDKFTAGMKVNLEVLDQADNVISRGFDEKTILVNDYESTISENLYLQGIISFNLKEGKYRILAVISDKISKRERKLFPINFVVPDSKNILRPLVVQSIETKISSFDSIDVYNNGSTIPFEKPENDFIIPVTDTSIQFLKVQIKNIKKEKLLDTLISNDFSLKSDIRCINNEIVLLNADNKSELKYFYLKNISSGLNEGQVTIEVIPDDEPNNKAQFDFIVLWANKPLSLMDPEKAIEYLEIIESKDKVSELLRKNDSYEKILYDYWKDMDITPDTKYNELMKEFYQRVDFANKEFISIAGNGGALSDRGKIYIKYGEPFERTRDTNSEGKVVETWFYKNPNIKFVFIDKDGTGKFLMVNQQ
jgi:GWxTD domain-containing protein